MHPLCSSLFPAHLVTSIYHSAMTNLSQIIIRDGTLSDIPKCLQLDRKYHTEHVWQINIREEATETRHITLRKQRLPRPLDAIHNTDKTRLQHAIRQKGCFILMLEPESDMLLGYVSMRVNETYKIAHLQDIVVDKPFRKQGLGSRLLRIAQQWANEKNLNQIIFEIPTTNYPTIKFAQSHGSIFTGFNDHYLPSEEIALFFSLPL